MDTLTIGEVAKQVGIGVETVRYYEREGLIEKPSRRPSGYRQYTLESVRRLQFIRHAKELGFSLKDIAELLALRVDPSTTCADIKSRAVAKIADIENRIQELRRMKRALSRVADRCKGKGPTSKCPILEELDGRRR